MSIQWPLVIFSLLCGTAGMMMAAMGVAEILGIGSKVRVKGIVSAFVILVVGGFCVLLHLAQPGNVMGAFTHITSMSPISVEMLAVGVNAIVAIVFFFLARGENPNAGALKVVGVIAIITGIMIAILTGNGYVMESQPAWNNIGLPLGYLGTAAAAGFGLYGAILAIGGEEGDLKNYALATIVMGALAIVLPLIYAAMNGFTVNIPLFVIGVLIVGGIGTIAGGYLAMKGNKNGFYIAAVCGLIGGLCFRIVMWLACTGYLSLFSEAAIRAVL